MTRYISICHPWHWKYHTIEQFWSAHRPTVSLLTEIFPQVRLWSNYIVEWSKYSSWSVQKKIPKLNWDTTISNLWDERSFKRPTVDGSPSGPITEICIFEENLDLPFAETFNKEQCDQWPFLPHCLLSALKLSAINTCINCVMIFLSRRWHSITSSRKGIWQGSLTFLRLS